MQGFARYEKLMADWAAGYLMPIYKAHKNGAPNPPSDHGFFTKIFKGFNEISSTVEALRLAHVFVSLAPPKSRRIDKDKYLKYHVSVYLQEVYILKERLNAYATRVQRAYSKSSQKTKADIKIAPLFDLVKTALDGVVETRGNHVHDTRYSDDDLDWVSTLALASQYEKELVESFNWEYKQAMRTWKDRINHNNKETEKLLDKYFDALFDVITVNNEVLDPTN